MNKQGVGAEKSKKGGQTVETMTGLFDDDAKKADSRLRREIEAEVRGEIAAQMTVKAKATAKDMLANRQRCQMDGHPSQRG